MFKMLKPRGGVFGLGRLPLRLHSQAQQNPMNIQKVRFYEPFRPRHVITSFVTIAIAYTIAINIVLAPLDKFATELEAEKASNGKQGKEDEEEEEHSIFIPFPGTIKTLQPRPYRGSDPEWQEFIKFSKDIELGKRVRNDLAQYIISVCERSPALTMRCGKDVKLRRFWLDVDFPTSPPPEFERSGIEISDNFISWTTMPVDSLTVFRLRHVLWPSAVTQAFWSFSKVLITGDSAKVAGILEGQNKAHQPSIEDILARHSKKPGGQLGKPEGLSNDDMASTSSRSLEPPEQSKTSTSSTIDKPSDNSSKNSVNLSGKTELERLGLGQNVPSLSYVRMHMLGALTAFQQKLMQTWKPAPNYPPRGSLLVSGLVELDTPKAWVVVDVKAAWDPKTRQYDPRSMHIQFRRLQMKKQAPLGGR